MRKIICMAMLCLYGVSGFAQGSFYLSAQAGPSFAYSNSNSYFSNSNKKLTANYGIGFGYEFPNQLLKAETGIYRTNIYSIFGLNDYTNYYEDDQVYLVSDSWQVPLRFKFKFWQLTDKITFRAITGIVLSLTPDHSKFKGDIINVSDFSGGPFYSEGTTFQTPSSAERNTSFLVYRNLNSRGFGAVDSNWLIESGLEMNYKFTDKLSGNVGIVYQGGLQNKYGAVIYPYWYDPDTNKNYFSSELTASSQAKALNLNFGLAYALSK